MYQIKDDEPEKLIEIAVELRSRSYVECDNSGLSYPIHTKLIHFKIKKSNYNIEQVWNELNKLGFYNTLWFIQSFWISEEVAILGTWVAEHEELNYSIYKKDDRYYLLNEKELFIVGESIYFEELPKLISQEETINNFVG